MATDFIGSGWAYPLRVTPAGGIAMVTGHTEIEQAITLILRTSPGERPMRPDFGSGLHDYVFAPADVTTAGLLAFEVRAALDHWEPRIEVDDVVVTVEESSDEDPGPVHKKAGLMYIDIIYRLRGENDVRNLVFPFYTIPEEG